MNRKSMMSSVVTSVGTIRRKGVRSAGSPPGHGNPRLRLLRQCWAFLVLLSLLAVPRAWSQQQAAVSGIITDPSGAVIPGATIHVVNIATQVITTAVTNSTGYYVAGNLVPGMYTITVEKAGFMTATRSAFALQVAQPATVDFKLQVGQVSQTVSIKATPPLVETSGATVGQVIGPTEMAELPLNGRNYFNLAELAPGVSTCGLRSFYSSELGVRAAFCGQGRGSRQESNRGLGALRDPFLPVRISGNSSHLLR